MRTGATRSVRITRAATRQLGQERPHRQTKAACRCRDDEGMEVCSGDASEGKVDRVLDDDEHDAKHQSHHDPNHCTDCRKSMGRYPPDADDEC